MKRIWIIIALACRAGSGADAQDAQDARTLAPMRGVHDFDLRGDARALFSSVAAAFGLTCVFDADYTSGPAIRFRLQEAGYDTALRALEEATRSFIVPLAGNSLLVANDTPEKRSTVEPFVAVTIDIPEVTSREELTSLVAAVQQTMAIEKIGIDAGQNRVVLRGPVSKIVPARVLFENLLHHRPEVSIELEVLEVSRNDLLVYGLDLPTALQIVNLDAVAKVKTSLAALAKGGIGGLFGANIGNAALLAQMEQSSGRSLLRLELRSRNGQPATFHAGDRYPVLTAAFVGSSPAAASGGDSATPAAPGAFGNVPNPSALAVADFNRDGVPDFAAAASDGDSVAVFFGHGDGSFADPATFTTGSAPSAIAAADLNGDGVADLVTANAGSNTVSVLLGRTGGTFEASTDTAVGSRPVALAVADFNHDGFPDLVTANIDSNDLSILLGDGSGAFGAAQPLLSTSGPRALVAADLNSDERPDLAVVNSVSNDLAIYLSNGDGTFRAAGTYPTGKTPVALAVADLNFDGAPDLTVVNSKDNSISVFIADGRGAFADGVAYPAGNNPTNVAVRDFNFDSVPDILVTAPDDGAVLLLPGLGNGSVQSPIAFHTGTKPAALAVADWNRNGVPDLLVANPLSDNFSVLLGMPAGGFRDPSGQDFPATGQSFAPTPQFQFEDLGLVVKATPHVNGVSDVTLDLDAEFKSLTGRASSGIPVIANRKLSTQVRLRNGEWALVAGLLSDSDAHEIAGFPVKPLARRTRDRANTQVLVLIRPNLLSLPPDEFVTAPVPLGSETRPRSPL